MGFDGIDLLNDMEEVVVAADVVDGLGGDDRVLDGMRSLVNISTRERMEPSSKIDHVALIEEFGSEKALVRAFIDAGIYPFVRIDHKFEQFSPFSQKGGISSGDLLRGNYFYMSGYDWENNPIFFVEGVSDDGETLLVRKLLTGGWIELSMRRGRYPNMNCVEDFCTLLKLGQYSVDDFPNFFKQFDDEYYDPDAIDDAGSYRKTFLYEFLDKIEGILGMEVGKYLRLRGNYFRVRRIYLENCRKYRKTSYYSGVSVGGDVGQASLKFYYPLNDDFFGGEPRVCLDSMASISCAIRELCRRNDAYPRIIRLLGMHDWETLERDFPEGQVNIPSGVRGMIAQEFKFVPGMGTLAGGGRMIDLP